MFGGKFTEVIINFYMQVMSYFFGLLHLNNAIEPAKIYSEQTLLSDLETLMSYPFDDQKEGEVTCGNWKIILNILLRGKDG